jgi:hypothetical protein
MYFIAFYEDHGTGLEKAGVSQKHRRRFFDDFMFLRNTGRAAKQNLGPDADFAKQKTEIRAGLMGQIRDLRPRTTGPQDRPGSASASAALRARQVRLRLAAAEPVGAA